MPKDNARTNPATGMPLPDRDAPSDAMQFLTLSIFILLLAFFVILNVHSQLDGNKVDPVLASVEKHFAKSIYGHAGKPAAVDQNNATGEGSAPDAIAALFTAASISFTLEKVDGDSAFMITLSKQDFRHALGQAIDGLIVSGDAQAGKMYERYVTLFTQLSMMLEPQEDNLQYHMTVFAQADTRKPMQNDTLEDITYYKDSLKTIGFSSDTVSYGLRPDLNGQVRFYFSPKHQSF